MQRRAWLPLAMVLATLVSAWLTFTRLHVSGDLSALFPDRAGSAALSRFVRVFGGGDVAAVLVRGTDPGEVAAGTDELGQALRARPSVALVLDRALPRDAEGVRLDPTLAWRYAGPAARERLARALTPDGMRARLDTTRDLLLVPGSREAEGWLARDPLRLAQIPFEGETELAAGVSAGPGGDFTADEGRARLIVLAPRGSAFDTAASDAFVSDVEGAMRRTREQHPSLVMSLTGGHAIAHATAAMLIRDLAVSGTLSLVLASAMFLVTFRRARALAAVLPPLVVGTLWTTALAALAREGLSAIAIAFTAVVVGVGVDTGVHVYAALLEGRRLGLDPHRAASYARARTWRSTLLAAVAAGVAFGSLALSQLAAIRELGILCGLGEVLTAVAILLVTPEMGRLLERGAPPPLLAPGWLRAVSALTATRARARIALVCAFAPAALLLVLGWPRAASAIVAVRPRALEPLATQEEIYRLFGGHPGQWVLLSIDTSADLASARADAVVEALEPLAGAGVVDGFDGLATFAPAPSTQRMRLASRDALDLPAHREMLRSALVDRGFDVTACAPALDAFDHPSTAIVAIGPGEHLGGALDWLVARHLAGDGKDTLAATYVRPRGDAAADARALAAIHAADPRTIVTGYPFLEAELSEALARDLPRIALVALVLVAIALRAMLGRAKDVALALATIVAELACVGLAMRALHLRWHIYDALVLPVLIGVTIDESIFLLSAAREAGRTDAAASSDGANPALRTQGPLVASTALTTAAGFAALLACRFEGLRDLAAVGTLGVLFGLIAALLVVPAGLRLMD